MNRQRKTLVMTAILVAGFSFSNSVSAQVTIDAFDLNPKVVPTTSSRTFFQMHLAGSIDVAGFNSECGANASQLSWRVYEVRTGPDSNRASGNQPINRTSGTVNFNISTTISFDTTGMDLLGSNEVEFYAKVYCPNPGVFTSSLDESDRVQITFGSADLTFACVAADNRYACSPANLSNCSDVPACAGRQCTQINQDLCGQIAPDLGGPQAPGPAPGPGQPVEFEITPPTQVRTLTDLARAVARFLLQIAIPIAVIIIIWAGVLILTSQGNKDRITQGRKALLYAVIGLAVILIGQGFVTLVQSILDLGGPTP